MMNYGSTLRMVLMDNTGKKYYEEPFTLKKDAGTAFYRALEHFKDGCAGAINDIDMDIGYNEETRHLPDTALVRILEQRGYQVTKNE